MRITFVLAHAGMSGGVRVVGTYANLLKQRGHDVVIISTPHRWPRRRDRLYHGARRLCQAAIGRSDSSHLDDVDVEHRVIRHGPPVIDTDLPDADVVVATWWETAEWVAALDRRKGAKSFFVQHYEAHDSQPIERVNAAWRLPLHKIAISSWLVDIARDRFDDHDVSLVPNAVDLDLFHAPPRAKRSTPTVGLMYSYKTYKGCDICVRAIELARRQIPELRVVAFGAHGERRELPLPCRTDLEVLPAQERLREIYASCDAWLFGSRTEGFGLPLLEAMACRTPVIATPAGAAPELIGQGGGVLVAPEDPEDMARAIVDISNSSPNAWRAMSDRAHQTACSYTWGEATMRFEVALRRAIEKSGTAAGACRRSEAA
jgi:glycosyltransferase involved in cell wall biosynthesis